MRKLLLSLSSLLISGLSSCQSLPALTIEYKGLDNYSNNAGIFTLPFTSNRKSTKDEQFQELQLHWWETNNAVVESSVFHIIDDNNYNIVVTATKTKNDAWVKYKFNHTDFAINEVMLKLE